MIKKFDTSFGGSGSGSTNTGSSSSKGIITLIAVVGIAFLGYKFIVKPMLEKRENENK
jgi:Tfp pilus assembly protein PilO